MRGSRVGWAMGIIAPWCLAVGLLVSISADAGQDAVMGGSLVLLSDRAPDRPAVLVPDDAVGLEAVPSIRSEAIVAVAALRAVSLELGEKQDFAQWADEIEPHTDLKRFTQTNDGKAVPVIDRSRKTDPLIGLRPTFDTNLRKNGDYARLRARDLLFAHDEASPTGGFSPADGDVDGPESVAAFEPWPDGENPTTAPARADASPAAAETGSTATRTTLIMRPSALNERLAQGATPPTPRALALASTTPAPADTAPVEVVFQRSKNAPDEFIERQKPSYAALIGADRSASEKRCLAEAIYFEARSETEEGQAAVAQVVLNRVASGLYPASICGVVYQNRSHYHGCQFSFACEGKSLRVNEPEAWRDAVRVADSVIAGRTYLADVGNSTHYHADYVRPRWAKALKKMEVIGRHIFYRLRPGQS